MPADRGVAERPGRSEVGDAQLLLEREARRHHLPKDADDRGVGQRSAVVLAQAREHLRFALGPIRRAAAARLQRADRLGVHGALVQAREDLPIEHVDRIPMHA